MEYLYYKSEKGNFGDDLNPWLWDQLIPEIKNAQNYDEYFLGIGSILHTGNGHLKNIVDKRKIIFGTGVRPSWNYTNLKVDDKWDIRFLRGPLSSKALDNKYRYITDGAYCIRCLKDFNKRFLKNDKKYDISLMPYYKSIDYFDWPAICKKLGYHYISPLSEKGVEHTLNEISSSKVLITEAMHGAILADALRVPWHRFILSTPYTEGAMVAEFKWEDWMQSIGIYTTEKTYIPFYRKSFLHKKIMDISLNRIHATFFSKAKTVKEIERKLGKVEKFYLSDEETLAKVDVELEKEINELKLYLTN